ncbi:MAG: family 78 glycoside hydrolase catalytic domain, partial [Armatimonadota bacterium]
MEWMGKWIWSEESLSGRNAYVRFRRGFEYCEGPALLHITADSRYVLHVNGEYVGQGPARAWPNHWGYDTYDVEPYLHSGSNVIAVLVNHFGEGNMQYIPAPAGLLAQLELSQMIIPTDCTWLCKPCRAYVSKVPRISVMQAFEEQFDARLDDDWRTSAYQADGWSASVEVSQAQDGFHNNLAPRSIPFLTLDPVLPKRVVSVECVRSVAHQYTVNLKPHLAPGDLSCNMIFRHAYMATQIWSADNVVVEFTDPHCHSVGIKVNGLPIEHGEASLLPGWNSVIVKLATWSGFVEQVVCAKGPPDLVFNCRGDGGAGAPWALIGPFALSEKENYESDHFIDKSRLIAKPALGATCEAGDELWECGKVTSMVDQPFFNEIANEHILKDSNVFARSYTDEIVEEDVRVKSAENLLSNGGWTVVYPSPTGCDVRILFDFGDEVLAFHDFEVIAQGGTIIDFHNFEFIQPDGRLNFAEGMNNSFRYVCRDGRQRYQTLVHRGFRYSYMILRNMTTPVRLRGVRAIFNSYPQTGRGSFACSDPKLDRIWEIGTQTLRCCSEDTYTDCPTYEQVLWVGDARNEALIDWVVNGDPRLWFRFLELTGQSLELSPLTRSQVPSSWDDIIPAWSFLWMRSCLEYLEFTGDCVRASTLLGMIERNVEGVLAHLDSWGLFSIHAFNMFDWAEMDTPSVGVVTHQNCLAVLALKEVAKMARLLKRDDLALKWTTSATALGDAINRYLWNEEVRAYTDCLHGGKQSMVYSQQTQTTAYISGVSQADRAVRCMDIMQTPPDGFVKAGSAFFTTFLLEAYQGQGKTQELLNTIRRDWGFMTDMGATTFWEMWSNWSGRLTRSHCHAWSAMPTFFLSTYVLGVRPDKPGFSVTVIEPHPADLTWCRGRMPAPMGDI